MRELERDVEAAPGALGQLNFVGRSPEILATLEQIRKVAACEATTLLQGETGSGKELAARAIHYLGARATKPFVPVNCGALPENLIANELFGHVRGAYTDAGEEQRGLVVDAHGGTLFLDEVETLSAQAQAALLRFLQDGGYRPLGGRSSLRADVRVVAATNADLRALVRAGQFRADLYYRLDVMNVSLPPLRARGDDVVLLAEHFLDRLSRQLGRPAPTLSPESLPALLAYGWPGNVRELENLTHRAFVLAEHGVARPELFLDLSASAAARDSLRGTKPPPRALDQGLGRAKAAVILDFERSFVSRAMLECHGNVTAAARRCGKERRTFGKLLKKLGIDRLSYVPGATKP